MNEWIEMVKWWKGIKGYFTFKHQWKSMEKNSFHWKLNQFFRVHFFNISSINDVMNSISNGSKRNIFYVGLFFFLASILLEPIKNFFFSFQWCNCVNTWYSSILHFRIQFDSFFLLIHLHLLVNVFFLFTAREFEIPWRENNVGFNGKNEKMGKYRDYLFLLVSSYFIWNLIFFHVFMYNLIMVLLTMGTRNSLCLKNWMVIKFYILNGIFFVCLFRSSYKDIYRHYEYSMIIDCNHCITQLKPIDSWMFFYENKKIDGNYY